MGQKGEKMALPLKVKLHLKDGQRLSFEKVKFKATPVGVWIIEQDKPDITRLFPWGNIVRWRSHLQWKIRRSSGLVLGWDR